jgi:hypothetical protein
MARSIGNLNKPQCAFVRPTRQFLSRVFSFRLNYYDIKGTMAMVLHSIYRNDVYPFRSDSGNVTTSLRNVIECDCDHGIEGEQLCSFEPVRFAID